MGALPEAGREGGGAGQKAGEGAGPEVLPPPQGSQPAGSAKQLCASSPCGSSQWRQPSKFGVIQSNACWTAVASAQQGALFAGLQSRAPRWHSTVAASWLRPHDTNDSLCVVQISALRSRTPELNRKEPFVQILTVWHPSFPDLSTHLHTPWFRSPYVCRYLNPAYICSTHGVSLCDT